MKRSKSRGFGLFGTVSRRIVAIVGFLALVFLLGATYQFVREQDAAQELKARMSQERGSLIQRIQNAEMANSTARAKEVAGSQALPRLAADPSDPIAQNELSEAIQDQELSLLLLFDGSGNRLASTVDSEQNVGFAKKLIPGRSSPRPITESKEPWYQLIDGQIVECASFRFRLKDKSDGWVVAAKVWDEATLSHYENLTGSKVTVHGGDGVLSLANSQKLAPLRADEIANILTLPGASGEPIAQIEFRSISQAVAAVSRNSVQSAAAIIIFVSSFILLLSIALQVGVARPMQTIEKGLSSEPDDRLLKLTLDPTEFGRIAELILAFNDQKHQLEDANVELQSSMNELAVMNEKLETRVVERTRDLYEAYEATIEGWSRAMEVRDQETEGHCRRVTTMSMLLGKTMGLSSSELVRLKRGALLHDIGKMGIPDGVLLKPGRLTAEERTIMEQHPIIAYEMLKPIKFLADCLDVPLYHHEKWDGTGYPYGLKGDIIPKNARIFAVADVWDAMRSDRPYRQAWDEAKTRDFIIELSGSHFDPDVVNAYLALSAEALDAVRTPSGAIVQESLPRAA